MYTGMSYAGGVGGTDMTQLGSFLGNLSSLKDKVHQVQSLVTLFFSHENMNPPRVEGDESTIASMATLVQEIVVTASSMMFNCQQMAIYGNNNNNCNNNNNFEDRLTSQDGSPNRVGQSNTTTTNNNNNNNNLGFLDGGSGFSWFNDNISYTNTATTSATIVSTNRKAVVNATSSFITPQGYDIVELDADALLAKYTHYCQVCGKGFKRDANLRMHMRAHGDAYKSSAALTNPLKNKNNNNTNGDEGSPIEAVPRKYSCPHMGCRWNKNHAKFQPLKSMICVKNHYKRSHCPKMYVCKRCNHKQFSVLSDLRTHEKHCGDLKWQCSCGTTFSRKDKLMGHVALFIGHTPMVSPLAALEHPTNKVNFDNIQEAFQNQLL